MLDLILKKLGILKEEMRINKVNSYDYDFHLIEEMLKSSANYPESVFPLILRLETDICTKLSRKTHQDFYKKLDAVNREIIAYDKSCLVVNF